MILSRRQFLAGVAGTTLLFGSQCGTGIPHGGSFPHRLGNTCGTILRKERSNIATAANHAAHTILRYGTVFLYTGIPDRLSFLFQDYPGLPRVFTPLRSMEMANTATGDTTVISFVYDDIVRRAVERGATLVLIDTPWLDAAGTPASNDGTTAEPDVLIQSHVNWSGKSVADGHNEPVMPGTRPVALTIISMLAAEIWHRSGGIGRNDDNIDYATSFGDILSGRLQASETQMNRCMEAGELIAGSVTRGGRVFIHDNSHILTVPNQGSQETPGVPSFLGQLTRQDITNGVLQSRDTLIMTSLRSNVPRDMISVRTVQKITDNIVTICPYVNEGGWRLFNEARVALDNLSPENDGVITIDASNDHYLHTGAIMNEALLWSSVEAALPLIAESLQGTTGDAAD